MAQTEYQKLQMWLFDGTYLDPKTKEIHPLNLDIKALMRQSGLTHKELSQITGIPKRRLSKALNNWYPVSGWIRDQILMNISAGSDN